MTCSFYFSNAMRYYEVEKYKTRIVLCVPLMEIRIHCKCKSNFTYTWAYIYFGILLVCKIIHTELRGKSSMGINKRPKRQIRMFAVFSAHIYLSLYADKLTTRRKKGKRNTNSCIFLCALVLIPTVAAAIQACLQRRFLGWDTNNKPIAELLVKSNP